MVPTRFASHWYWVAKSISRECFDDFLIRTHTQGMPGFVVVQFRDMEFQLRADLTDDELRARLLLLM
jgi:hypothetical protein